MTLFGEAGVSATALMWSFEKPLLSINDKNGWEYWNSNDGFKMKKEEHIRKCPEKKYTVNGVKLRR